MGFSPSSSAVRRERSSPHAALQCGQEPSDRRDGRFSATLGAEGGTHRLVANSIDYAEAKQREGHAPEYVEWGFSEVVASGSPLCYLVCKSSGGECRARRGEGMRRVVLVLAAMAIAMLLASGVALAVNKI